MTDREKRYKTALELIRDIYENHPDAGTPEMPQIADLLYNQAIQALSEAPGEPSEERDYTPEEALAELKKRWPDDPFGMSFQITETGQYCIVRGSGYDEESVGWGNSFRAAFAAADKDKLQMVDGLPVREGEIK